MSLTSGENNLQNVSILIPVYNEEETLPIVLSKICELDFVLQVILIDDCSSDGTRQIAEQFSKDFEHIETINHNVNRGKTAAIKTGLEQVTGDIVIIQDADLEYDPGEIQYVCEPIWHNRADVVYGSRFLTRRASRVLYYYHYLANKALTFLSNLFTNKNMTDIETCYKAFRKPLITQMPIKSSGFGFEVEVTAKISKTNARVYEVPISYYGRTYEEGKKISTKDGVMAFFYILYYNLLTSKALRNYCKASNAFLDNVSKERSVY